MPVKIAIFEDNDRLRESLAYLLKMNNYEIVGDYSQCTEAANIARVYQPDVVLMDIDMPGQSGIKGVALIKEARPDTAVIMYTVFEDDEKLFQCLCAGANGYLLKKTPPARLFDAIQEVLEFTSTNSETIRKVREQTKLSVKQQDVFPISWSLNKSRFSEVLFRGFEAGQKTSGVSGLSHLYYDRTKPFETKVKFYNFYQPETSVKKPVAYILPQGWWRIVDLLKSNKVNLVPLAKDTLIEVEAYHIDDYKSTARPVEGHHVNTDVAVSSSIKKVRFRKGDYYIPMNQIANRFLIEVLEPHAPDSYFAWNYFDGILGQKEGYSDYAFEETAVELLKNNPGLKTKLENRRKSDTAF